MMRNEKAFGVIIAIIAASLWAAAGPAAKLLFEGGLPVTALVQARLAGAAIVIMAYLVIFYPSRLKVSGSKMLSLFVLGITGVAAVQFLYFYSLEKIGVSIAITLEYTAPAFVALFFFVFRKQGLSFLSVSALVASLSGVVLATGIITASGFQSPLEIDRNSLHGILAGLGCGVALAWYSIHGENVGKTLHSSTITAWTFFYSAAFWICLDSKGISFLLGLPGRSYALIFFIVIGGTLLPSLLFVYSLQKAGARAASLAGAAEPVIAVGFASIVLTEKLDCFQWLGIVLVIYSVVTILKEQGS